MLGPAGWRLPRCLAHDQRHLVSGKQIFTPACSSHSTCVHVSPQFSLHFFWGTLVCFYTSMLL